MRIDHIHIRNFKCFKDREILFHPEFTLLAGANGTGKTSILDALAVALGSWFLGVSGCSTRHIWQSEVRQMPQESGSGDDTHTNWERSYPVKISANGSVAGEKLSWERTLNGRAGRTTYVGAGDLKARSSQLVKAVQEGHQETVLPLVAYYGTGRLWDTPRERPSAKRSEETGKTSRLDGYNDSIDPRLSVSELVRWIERQTLIGLQRKGATPSLLTSVREAILRCVEGGTGLHYDFDYGEVIMEIEGQGNQPFYNLSDGQRSMLAMVGDIARKAATLNPHLGDRAVAETPGVVIIDELDLHLHPRWQRHLIEDLRSTFPKIQFICTTHSPFLIQSLRSGEELLLLDGQPTAQLSNLSIGEVTEGIMGVSGAELSLRYSASKKAARHYLEELALATNKSPKEKLAEFTKRLAEDVAPYADNPAYQAFLEMRLAAKLGE